MIKSHRYSHSLLWTGNQGKGTSDYRSYERSYEISIEGKPIIKGSADPAFRGNIHQHNPEDLFLASISSCHMLWYLHLCSVNGIIIVNYTDQPEGIMEEKKDGSGQFTSVILHPTITITNPSKIDLAKKLHHEANQKCFIANSCNFPIQHVPMIHIQE